MLSTIDSLGISNIKAKKDLLLQCLRDPNDRYNYLQYARWLTKQRHTREAKEAYIAARIPLRPFEDMEKAVCEMHGFSETDWTHAKIVSNALPEIPVVRSKKLVRMVKNRDRIWDFTWGYNFRVFSIEAWQKGRETPFAFSNRGPFIRDRERLADEEGVQGNAYDRLNIAAELLAWFDIMRVRLEKHRAPMANKPFLAY